MFADIAGSSALYAQLGDQHANELVDAAVRNLSTIVGTHNGRVIKTIGDEVMAQFSLPLDACKAAIAMQQQSQQSVLRMDVRIGMATGPTVERDNDVFGEVVNDAAAVAHIAQGQQILGNDTLFEHTRDGDNVQWLRFDHIHLKGKSAESTIYRLNWQPATHNKATKIFSIDAESTSPPQTQLYLAFQGTELFLRSQDTPFFIGRESDRVNLAIDSHYASRQHLQILYRRGKFVLIDRSTNGTYLHPENGEEMYLRREEMPLTQCGLIGLGESTAQPNDRIIYYSTQRDNKAE